MREQVVDQLQVHAAGHAHGGMLAVGRDELVLGRGRGRRHQMALAVVDQEVEAELGGALHQGVGRVSKERLVPAELVVLPEVLAEPGAGHRPEGPGGIALAEVAHGRGLAPDVGVVVRDPAAAAVVDPRRLASVDGEAPDQVEERLVALGEVRHLGGPHVHLGIDVDRPVAAPGSANLVVPDPLEIGGLGRPAGSWRSGDSGRTGSGAPPAPGRRPRTSAPAGRWAAVLASSGDGPRSSVTRRNRR